MEVSYVINGTHYKSTELTKENVEEHALVYDTSDDSYTTIVLVHETDHVAIEGGYGVELGVPFSRLRLLEKI